MADEPLPRERFPVSPAAPSDLYRLLVEAVEDYAIFALDPTGHIMSWNRGARRIKQWRAGEILGQHFSIFYPPEDLAWDKPGMELEVAGRVGRFEDEGWRLRKDGTRFWANVVITALRDDDGKLVGFAKVTRDLTVRQEALEALRLSEERFRLLVTSVRDYGIFMLDPEGRVASWNEGAEFINGYTMSEILGQHFSIFYPPEDLAWDKPGMELEVAGRVGRFEDEGWRLRKDGTRFWANVVITALRDDDGKLVGFAKVTRDLTERRAAEQRALADARQIAHAEAANRSKSEFLAAMSHELRTPLNAIGGYAELLATGVRGSVNAEQLADLERIQRSQRHLLGIINDLLNFSRIEAGQVDYDVTTFAADDVVRSVIDIMGVQATGKGVVLEVGNACAAEVVADRAKTEQVMLNLLSNAIKFTASGGRVSLHCHADDQSVCVEVRDTGTGIPADKLESIFEPFVQVGRSLSNPGEGTGLGLAISRDLARGMRGDLTVQSALGDGSSFMLRLPRADAR